MALYTKSATTLKEKREKPAKVTNMKTLLNLFPNVEFEVSNNEEEDVEYSFLFENNLSC